MVTWTSDLDLFRMQGADPQNLAQMQRETQLVSQQVEMNKANRKR
jgi:hypothetical protein